MVLSATNRPEDEKPFIQNLFRQLYPKPDATPDFNDEIARGSCVTRDGEIVNEAIRKAIS